MEKGLSKGACGAALPELYQPLVGSAVRGLKRAVSWPSTYTAGGGGRGIAAGQSQLLAAKRDGAHRLQLAGLPGHPAKDGEPRSHASATAALGAKIAVGRQQFRLGQQPKSVGTLSSCDSRKPASLMTASALQPPNQQAPHKQGQAATC